MIDLHEQQVHNHGDLAGTVQQAPVSHWKSPGMASLGHSRSSRGLCQTLLACASVCLIGLVWPVLGQQGAPTPESTSKAFVTPAAESAASKGLAYLAGRQNADGSFGNGAVHGHAVAETSLAGLAFIAAGNTPQRGKYGKHVHAAVQYVLSQSAPNGFLCLKASDPHGPMYDHGFATLFLAEVYGMSPVPELRDKLALAVKLIVNTQNKEGGWRYYPIRDQADISVTVCQLMALRAARNAGITVPKETIDACVQYVQKCQNPDGGFRYQMQGAPQSAFPRSAAALVTLYSAGIYEGRTIERGLRYLEQHVPAGDVFRNDNNYFYGHYYAVQAMWHAGGNHWARWYPAIRDELVMRQLPDGSWHDPVSGEYATSMACIVLQLPNQYLPIFQR